MRVLLNGRDVGGLDPRLERRLWGRRNDAAIEAVTMSPREAIAVRAKQLRLLLGGVGALVVLLMALNLAIVIARAPQALGYVAPIVAGVAVFVGDWCGCSMR